MCLCWILSFCYLLGSSVFRETKRCVLVSALMFGYVLYLVFLNWELFLFGQFWLKKFIELLRKGTTEHRDSAISCLRTAFAPCALDASPVRFNYLLHFSIFGIQLIAITYSHLFTISFIDGLVKFSNLRVMTSFFFVLFLFLFSFFFLIFNKFFMLIFPS